MNSILVRNSKFPISFIKPQCHLWIHKKEIVKANDTKYCKSLFISFYILMLSGLFKIFLGMRTKYVNVNRNAIKINWHRNAWMFTYSLWLEIVVTCHYHKLSLMGNLLQLDEYLLACEYQGHIDGFSTDKHGWGTQGEKFGIPSLFAPRIWYTSPDSSLKFGKTNSRRY